MSSIINAETFTASETQPEHGYFIKGTVQVTLRGETRTVPAIKGKRGDLVTAYGMSGRYQTGTKAWPASVQQMIDPRTGKIFDHVQFGRDDRSGRFQKANCLFFS